MADRRTVKWVVGLALVFLLLVVSWVGLVIVRFRSTATTDEAPTGRPLSVEQQQETLAHVRRASERLKAGDIAGTNAALDKARKAAALLRTSKFDTSSLERTIGHVEDELARKRGTPTRQQDEDAATDRRLWLSDHAADDAARHFILRGVLSKGGYRCDRVERAIMGASPGVWRVECSPGYRYGFFFDGRGQLLRAIRL